MTRVISRTPMRISFFGGGTDYPEYYLRCGGATLGTTINKYIYVNVSNLSDFFDYRLRVSYSKIELVGGPHEVQHPSVRACLLQHELQAPLNIEISADLPTKTGLGSSSAFTVGLLNALYGRAGKKVSKQRLAEEACFIEQEKIRENVGSQDQFHAAFGGMNVIEFQRGQIRVRPLVISREKKAIFAQHLLIFYTGITRFASEVLQEQVEKTKQLNNDTYLKRMHEIVFEAEEIISQVPEIEFMQLLGQLLNEAWHLKKQLSARISSPLIDQFYEKALRSGAYGGKLCGAGSGGFLAFFVPLEKQAAVRETLKELLEVEFALEDEGSSIIYMKD